MSDVVPHKQALHRQGRLRRYCAEPEVILFAPSQAPEIRFADGSQPRASCLGCHDAPCMELTEVQLSLGGTLGAFPGDPSRDVCPTDAIGWDEAGEIPIIDTENCIGCGLCAICCPYGAISIRSDGVAFVEGADPDRITTIESGMVEQHATTPRAGALGNLAQSFVRKVPETLNRLTDTQRTRLARNMLVACGVAASMRRKGDTNIRMDGLLRFASGQIGVVELETGAAVLETPRALLEDVAVLHSRFDVPMENIIPISVIGALPNVRTEYYRVIDDIVKVLNIQCRTITFGALCLVMWRFAKLNGLDGDLFAAKASVTDLHSSLSQLIPDLPAVEPYPGAFRPSK